MSIVDQRAYYDRRWSAAAEELDEHQLARLAAIREALSRVERGLPAPWRILEVGCGTGWLAAELSAHGATTAVDLSPAAVELARSRYPAVTFAALDVSSAPLPGENDLVVASEVIEHVEDQAAFVERLAGAALPGGFLLLTTPNGRVEQRWRRHPGWSPQPVERWLSPRALRGLLEPHAHVELITTFFLDFDRSGVYGVYYADRFRRLGLARPAERLLRRAGYGLYTLALARLRPRARRKSSLMAG